jgi:alpha-galactosidase
MSISRVRTFALFAGVALCLALGVPRAILAAPVAGNPTPAWNGLALTPPMGYNNWSYFQCKINEDLILSQAKALVSTGLAKKGYDTITIDDCWMAKKRNSDGTLAADPQKFPHGMAWMGQQVHALGLKFGIYEDAGVTTCARFPGSWNFFQKDADTFAKWEVDYIKLDGCNVPKVPGKTNEETYRYAYKAFSDAILHTGRKMVYSESAPAYFENTPDDWYWDGSHSMETCGVKVTILRSASITAYASGAALTTTTAITSVSGSMLALGIGTIPISC